jgi:hypothetical protein
MKISMLAVGLLSLGFLPSCMSVPASAPTAQDSLRPIFRGACDSVGAIAADNADRGLTLEVATAASAEPVR